MATKLDKNLTRESSSQVEERNIIVTLTDKQEVSLKLKGMRSGEVNIPIKDLYHDLAGTEDGGPKEKKAVIIKHGTKKVSATNPMVPYNELRSKMMVADMPVEYKVKFEAVLKDWFEVWGKK